ALSLAGLPPLFGFLAKETLLATAVHPSLPVFVSWILAGAVVVAAAFKLVQAGLVSLEVFTGESRDEAVLAKVHEAPLGMLLPPAIPVLISLALGILPEPEGIATFFGYAAEAAHGSEVKVSFALWTGLNIPLFLSVIAISCGLVLYWQRAGVIAWQKSMPTFSFDRVYEGSLRMVDGAAWLATRLQNGMLRLYLGVMLLTMLGLVILFGGIGLLTLPNAGEVLNVGSGLDFSPIRLLSLIATVGAALATIFIRRDFFAILALGASGLGVAVYMAVVPAPDVALVQIVVDILATVILILAISRLPRAQRMQANLLNNRVQIWPLFISILGAALMTLISYSALITRPRTSLVSPFYSENSKALTGADDIVGAIIIDFRALDTVIEIAVFALAGLGIFTLIQYASKKHGDAKGYKNPIQGASLGSGVNSIYLKAIANLLLPVTMVVGAIHMLLGHNQPGDGFTAGVIISLGISFKYVVFGFSETRRRLWWLHPKALIGAGILLVISSGLAGGLINGSFLSPVDYGGLLGIPMPTGMKLSSGFLFEVAIALAVMGSVSLMLDTLGKPAINMVDVKKETEEPAVVPVPLAPQIMQTSRKKAELQIQTGGD
ncbi:MAG: hydrogen gas-evolving membrane-bound hydrogenase subunit E, partial [Chloroflexota bacterium]